MGFVNKVMLMGNTTRAPELRQLPSGTTVCDFALATNRVYKTTAGEEKQETVFIDCTAFGRVGEVIAEFCPKGRPLFIEGRLHFESWEDKNGNRRSKLSVIVENFQFIGSREGNDAPANAASKQRELPLRPGVQKEESDTRTTPNRRAASDRYTKGQRPDTSPTRARQKNQPASRGGTITADPTAIDQMAEESQNLDDADLPF